MKHSTLVLVLILLMASCGHNINPENQVALTEDPDCTSEFTVLKDLDAGEVYLNEDAFGEIISLTGESVPVDEIFQISGSQMLVRDSLLILKNPYNGNHIMVYSLPGLKMIHTLGKAGRGPEEFQYPSLIRSHNHDVVSYFYEMTQDKLFSLDKEFAIREMSFSLPKSSKKRFSDKQIQNLNDSVFYFVESTEKGKELFRINVNDDQADVSSVYNLSFNPGIKNWAVYIGDFAVSPHHNRLVYAYKYYKRLVFMDTESLSSKIVLFDEKEHQKPDLSDILGPQNVTHFWGVSAQKNHVYFLYSGRTPLDVHKQTQKTSGYIFVEQYDWNGTPVRKFRLDRWGYFCVDENEEYLYLLSTTDEHPIYRYNLRKQISF
jgi:hypothetical protein